MSQYKFKYQDTSLSVEERAKALISEMTLEEKATQLLHDSPAIERLEVPEYNWWNECLHGIARAGRATIFPQAIGLAAAFDIDLHRRIAQCITDEARAKYQASVEAGNRAWYKGLTFWTPNINIFRDPRWGRGQETYGEDPYLTSRLGVTFVKTLQQEKEGILKAAACAKHYAVHSGPEALRHEFDAKATPKDMRETYLPAFQALVQEAGVESVMGAYNRTNGEPCCGSKTLLQDILRDEWGFKGHVVSDCWAILDFHKFHKVTETEEESAAMALNNGCDLNCGCAFNSIGKAIEKGLLKEEVLDRALFNLLKTRIKLGIFDPPESNPWKDIPISVVDCDEHRALAREAAVKSMVLLKNSGNTLPLSKKTKKVLVVGPNATNIDALLANYYGMSSRIVSPLEGISAKVDESCTVDYRLGALLDRIKPNPVDWASFEAKDSDAVIACFGIDLSLEGEEGDALASHDKGDRSEIDLPEGQMEFMRSMKRHGTPIIAVVFGGSPIAINELHELADAVIWAWYPGEEGGNAVADVIFGDEQPAGKLPVTFPKSLDQLPPYEDYSMEGRTYRYMKEEPLYPFGFGLTYADLSYKSIDLDKKELKAGESLKISITLSNSSDFDAEEAIQLYVTDDEASTRVPLASLRGFNRVKIAAGSETTVDFTLTTKDLEIITDQGESVLEPGTFTLTAGSCSPGKRGLDLGAPQPLTAQIKVV